LRYFGINGADSASPIYSDLNSVLDILLSGLRERDARIAELEHDIHY
jgi:hypothetical protein